MNTSAYAEILSHIILLEPESEETLTSHFDMCVRQVDNILWFIQNDDRIEVIKIELANAYSRLEGTSPTRTILTFFGRISQRLIYKICSCL
jgi:hypothetical protein